MCKALGSMPAAQKQKAKRLGNSSSLCLQFDGMLSEWVGIEVGAISAEMQGI